MALSQYIPAGTEKKHESLIQNNQSLSRELKEEALEYEERVLPATTQQSATKHNKTKLHVFSPQANYTNRAAAACRRS
jgi:hypothetical protein